MASNRSRGDVFWPFLSDYPSSSHEARRSPRSRPFLPGKVFFPGTIAR
ncbi:hypothetical protein [Oxynema aestuarii]|uniref:Uncharacterized protein n=1 Tax=Oxynema aestuarii AP17 TaxID=2064643 RepID=A0A6H1U217_9CYAN|nr:hypothetical protein [Oxynema aestuarii]QIZ72871.1 hypothetical protein HCG48_21595 [Oxynema aestuarii AP17]